MSIEYICPGCQRTLRVTTSETSPRVRCPACNALFEIPSQSPAELSAPSVKWYVRIPEGLTYGPITQDVLSLWIAEGRIDARCDLRQEGQSIWQAAMPAPFPQSPAVAPATGPTAAASPMSSAPASPLLPPVSAPAPQRTSPSAPTGGGFQASQNGPIILVLGILSWLSCPVFGIAAWILGNRELELASHLPIDQSDRAMVKAGRLLGMINVLLVLGGLFVAAGMFVLFAVAWN